jgi:hypothetical protein
MTLFSVMNTVDKISQGRINPLRTIADHAETFLFSQARSTRGKSKAVSLGWSILDGIKYGCDKKFWVSRELIIDIHNGREG